MTLGQAVEYAIAWNEANDVNKSEKKETIKRRKARQSDWDAFLG